MGSYHRLALEERYQILALKDSGLSIRKIAAQLGRCSSTISRELRRNSGTSKKYIPKKAQCHSLARRAGVGPPKKVVSQLKDRVYRCLAQQWSPEQISGRLATEGLKISHETIYRFIYRDFKMNGHLYENLRRRHKRRRSRATTRNYKRVGKRTYENWIHKRPSVVEDRSRPGDFERDTVLGKFKGPVLLTIVDRTSRLTRIAKVDKVCSALVHHATVDLLRGRKVMTITNDNGPEFALFHVTEKELSTEVYFNHPYCSWQRGTNENTNGLIRQYYPKGTDFTKVSPEDLVRLEQLLNQRPRKCLGFKTPYEVDRLLNQGAALRS